MQIKEKGEYVPTKKEQCKAIMTKLFGPATAAMVDSMTEIDCISRCRAKVAAFMGEDEAKQFDLIK